MMLPSLPYLSIVVEDETCMKRCAARDTPQNFMFISECLSKNIRVAPKLRRPHQAFTESSRFTQSRTTAFRGTLLTSEMSVRISRSVQEANDTFP